MFSTADQHFLVQLAGYVMGMAGAGVVALYFLFRIFKGFEGFLEFIVKATVSLFNKKKTTV